GSTGTGPTPSHTYAAAGTHEVRLTITSNRGDTATTTRTVQVTRVNQQPTAAFTASCQGTVCSFDASGSTDAEGALTHTWDDGDGRLAHARLRRRGHPPGHPAGDRQRRRDRRGQPGRDGEAGEGRVRRRRGGQRQQHHPPTGPAGAGRARGPAGAAPGPEQRR